MGAPRRNRRKYEKPKERWNLERIKNDNELIEQYGLKNMKELWKVRSEISRIRGNARQLLSGTSQYEGMREKIIGRLARLGIVTPGAALDDLLDLKENSLLERRLQTVVFRKGLARSMRQARQLTVHGFIAINGRRVNRPGYIVDSSAEKMIGYYKPIYIAQPKASTEQAAETITAAQQPAAAEAGAASAQAGTEDKE